MEPEEIFVSVLVVRWCSVQEHLFCTSLFKNIKKKYHSIYVIRAIFAIKCKNAEGCVGH